jgi:selenocysteine lyase/cysteine desulfurase
MIDNQQSAFDIPPEIAYLNCAYLSPLLRAAAEAGHRGIERKRHPWTIGRSDFFVELEFARELFARLINAAPDDIALVPASSYGAAVAGRNLPLQADQNVLVIEGEHFSNVYQWMVRCEQTGAELVTVPRPDTGDWTPPILDRINERTSIVAVPNCHWHDGLLVDLEAVSRAAHQVGAALVIDGTQSIGALPFDVQKLKPAFVLCSAYKWLLGPYGMGFIYVSREHQDGVPLEHHPFNRVGAPHVASSITYESEFLDGARRYDVGQRSNFIQLPIIIAALDQILCWGVDNIQRTLTPLTRSIDRRAADIGLAVRAVGCGAGHLTGLRFPEGIPGGLQDALTAAGVYVSLRRDALRISPYLYNSEQDIDRLFEVLQTFASPARRTALASAS